MSLNLNDEQLLNLIKLGSQDAFAVLVKRHVTKFYYVALKLVKSKEDSEDIVQECFLKLWKSPQNFDEKQNVKFVTWFSKVVQNRSLDFLRKHKEEIIKDDYDVEDSAKNQLQIIEETYLQEMLDKSLDKLNPNQKQAILLSFFSENNDEKSAKLMNLSVKAYRSLLMRSKESLKSIVKKYDRK
jgi:RNA polymerase sigma-70 factor (ECF subfamily)